MPLVGFNLVYDTEWRLPYIEVVHDPNPSDKTVTIREICIQEAVNLLAAYERLHWPKQAKITSGHQQVMRYLFSDDPNETLAVADWIEEGNRVPESDLLVHLLRKIGSDQQNLRETRLGTGII